MDPWLDYLGIFLVFPKASRELDMFNFSHDRVSGSGCFGDPHVPNVRRSRGDVHAMRSLTQVAT